MKVMALAAHPDDIEFGMAGTMLLLKEKGCELHYMNFADGCCGTNKMDAKEAARVRGIESQNACAKLGATYYPPATHDLEVFYNDEQLAKAISAVRAVAPDILLVPSFFDYMEDHVYTARLAVMAAFCRGMPNAHCNPPRPIAENPIFVYHAQPHGHRDSMGKFHSPEFLINIDSVIDAKTDALGEHHSQRDWLDDSQGMDAYLVTMQDLCKEMGKLTCGKATFAEGWSRHNHLGFCDAGYEPIAQVRGKDAHITPQA